MNEQLIRTTFVLCDSEILSAYNTGGVGGPRHHLLSLNQIPSREEPYAGMLPLDVCGALLKLHQEVKALGGDLRISDARRRPSEESHKSWHHSGRAIDIDLDELNLKLSELWDLAKPLGWNPIISEPDPTQKEAWHFEFRGVWGPVKDRTSYRQASVGALLDLGLTREWQGFWKQKTIQANLQRAGFDCGEIDGMIGPKTRAAIVAASLSVGNPIPQGTMGVLLADLLELSSSEETIWSP